MTTDRDRLTAFFTALIQGRAYKMVHGASNELHLYDTPAMTAAAKDLAREMVDRLLGSEAAPATMDPGWPMETFSRIAREHESRADNDRRRRETLLAVAQMLTDLRDTGTLTVSRVPGINDMIARCHLDAFADGGVVHAQTDAPELADLGWHQIHETMWERGHHRVRVNDAAVWFEPIRPLSADDLTAFADLLRGDAHAPIKPLTLGTTTGDAEPGPWVVAWEMGGRLSAVGYWTRSEAETKARSLCRHAPVLRPATAGEAAVMRERSRGVALHDLQPTEAKP
jgi:hypothetical protein